MYKTYSAMLVLIALISMILLNNLTNQSKSEDQILWEEFNELYMAGEIKSAINSSNKKDKPKSEITTANHQKKSRFMVNNVGLHHLKQYSRFVETIDQKTLDVLEQIDSILVANNFSRITLIQSISKKNRRVTLKREGYNSQLINHTIDSIGPLTKYNSLIISKKDTTLLFNDEQVLLKSDEIYLNDKVKKYIGQKNSYRSFRETYSKPMLGIPIISFPANTKMATFKGLRSGLWTGFYAQLDTGDSIAIDSIRYSNLLFIKKYRSSSTHHKKRSNRKQVNIKLKIDSDTLFLSGRALPLHTKGKSKEAYHYNGVPVVDSELRVIYSKTKDDSAFCFEDRLQIIQIQKELNDLSTILYGETNEDLAIIYSKIESKISELHTVKKRKIGLNNVLVTKSALDPYFEIYKELRAEIDEQSYDARVEKYIVDIFFTINSSDDANYYDFLKVNYIINLLDEEIKNSILAQEPVKIPTTIKPKVIFSIKNLRSISKDTLNIKRRVLNLKYFLLNFSKEYEYNVGDKPILFSFEIFINDKERVDTRLLQINIENKDMKFALENLLSRRFQHLKRESLGDEKLTVDYQFSLERLE